MWSLRGFVKLIRDNAWTNAATPKAALPQSERRPSLWTPEDGEGDKRTSAGGGLFSAVISAWSGSLRSAPNAVENTLRGASVHESDHAEGGPVRLGKLQDLLDRLSRRYGTLMQTRDEMLEVHTKVQMEWARCADMRRFYLESQGRFMEQAEACLSTQDRAGAMELLRQLYRQTQADLNAMNVQAEITRNLEDRLSSIHFHLLRRDEAFFKSCHAIISLQPLSPATEKQIAASAVRVRSSSASNESEASAGNALHPTLESYYDKAGDVGLIGEELANLDVEYQEARGVRLFLAERDDSPSLSDSEFEENYRQAREQIEQRLTVAMQEAEKLRHQCIDEGLNLAERERPQSEGTDDLLLDRRSEILDPESIRSHRALHGDMSNWRMVGPDSLFRGGPVFRDPDESFGDEYEFNGLENVHQPSSTQKADLLRWASLLPDDAGPFDPEPDVPESQSASGQLVELENPSFSISPSVTPNGPPPADPWSQSWKRAMQYEVANMPDLRSRLSSSYESIQLQKQARDATRIEANDETSLDAWISVNVPRRRSTLTHLQRRQSFDANVSEGPSQKRYRLAALRSRVSSSELRLTVDPG
ncbi:hypothetical protein PRZ48_006075 [Zasmidium cellare]|uniref:Uncharacterized protein n=1 Tax=Zasmidium cellare TaxID=395010 RepID=A0ABR0EMQ6_ZASCE|nr:hypothetical protein PRZ48_006075 [Zasmidium cellare]